MGTPVRVFCGGSEVLAERTALAFAALGRGVTTWEMARRLVAPGAGLLPAPVSGSNVNAASLFFCEGWAAGGRWRRRSA